MNTLGLGRHVNTFQLGSPYGGVTPEPPLDYISNRGGRSQFPEENALWEIGQERIRREDEELLIFITSLVSKGIL